RVAIRFSGMATDTSIAEQEAKLRAWMTSNNLTPAGAPTYAYYNDPWTPGPLRRNEVLFDLEGPSDPTGVEPTTKPDGTT
ncbi:MAG: heme-binding protein, partial [Pseudomonadota bacterium]